MKRTLLLISAVLLSVVAGVQTAWGQKITLYMAGNQTHEYDISQVDSIVFSEGQASPTEEIIVTVDAYGNADGGHRFTRIDETTFLIDGLKYKYENGGLKVIGYDQVFFSGVAKIISKLIYNGWTMNVVSIGDTAFYYCTNLTSVTIPNSVTSISDSAFEGCSRLTPITIPNSVTSIGNKAFYGCSGLTFVIIPNSVTSIGYSAFEGCTGLTSVIIPESLTRIVSYTFYNCSSLVSITIPNGVTNIESGAFYGCSRLTSATIGSGITSIGNGAFSGCSSLTNVYCYAENVPSTSSSTFNNSSISSAILHVPAGSVDAYKAQAPWKYFESIVAIE